MGGGRDVHTASILSPAGNLLKNVLAWAPPAESYLIGREQGSASVLFSAPRGC